MVLGRRVRRGYGWPRRGHIDGSLKLLGVLLLLLLLLGLLSLLLIVRAQSAVAAASAPVEHYPSPKTTVATFAENSQMIFL